MKTIFPILLVVSLALAVPSLHAKEDHRAYRETKIAECTECHLGSGITPTHQVGWNADHRRLAVKEGAPCADCHEESFCQDCHYGGSIEPGLHATNSKRGPDSVPRSHRSGFIEVHPISAFDNPASCNRCHQPSFCKECHARFRPEELQFTSHRKGWSDRTADGGPKHSTFTPDMCQTCHPGSVLPKHEWAGEHTREARRNLASCQACHPDGDICLKCHSAKSGLRVNPHPDNWGSIKEKLNRAAGQRTCVKCH